MQRKTSSLVRVAWREEIEMFTVAKPGIGWPCLCCEGEEKFGEEVFVQQWTLMMMMNDEWTWHNSLPSPLSLASLTSLPPLSFYLLLRLFVRQYIFSSGQPNLSIYESTFMKLRGNIGFVPRNLGNLLRFTLEGKKQAVVWEQTSPIMKTSW